MNYINNYKSEYDLNNYNCSDFGIEIGRKAGINLPKTVGEYNFGPVKFKGRNPSDLGEDIRKMSKPSNGEIDKKGGKAPKKKGNC